MNDEPARSDNFDSEALARDERYRAFIEQSSEGIWRFELEEPVPTSLPIAEQLDRFYEFGYLAECNDAMAQMYGFSKATDVMGARLGDFLIRSDPSNIEYLTTFIESGYRLNDALSHERDRDGNDKFFLNNLVGILHDGNVVRAWGTQRDITMQKRAEIALRESEEKFRLIVESASDHAIFTTDMLGAVTSWNIGAERITGYKESEIIGRSSDIIFTPEDRVQGKPQMEIALALTDGRASDERWHVRQDGSRFWASGMMMPLRDDIGNVRGFLKIMQDHTSQRLAEEEREHLLEGERAARAEAERASRLKDEFLSTLSHELRTPLNAILGWSQLVRSGELGPQEIEQGLEIIERNARIQAELIEELLDMSRIISGKVRLDMRTVDLTAILHEAVETVRPTAEAKGVELLTAVDQRVNAVLADAGRLQQIIWNLLANAIKFTPSGGVVRAYLAGNTNDLSLSIIDTGQGIAPSFLPHIFERFRQADATTTRRHGGLGLGLAIVKNLVEMHGGTVEAFSGGENMGSTFTITIPRHQETHEVEGSDRRAQQLPSTSVAAAPPSLSGITVLVVDDDIDAAELARRLLERYEAMVVTSLSATEALQAIQLYKPDVLVSDIGMPEVDGYMLIKRVRQLSPDIGGMMPAIALTAFARSEDRTRALMAGFQTHVAKPVDPLELVTVIASLVGRI